MKRVDQLRSNYQSIKSKCKGPSLKLMLQSIKKQLLQLQQSSKKEDITFNKAKLEITGTNDTNSSHLSLVSNSYSNDVFVTGNILSDSLAGTDELCQLQARILQKQRLKFTLNEEIQVLQEKYLGLQQKIFVKKEKYGQLEKLIAKKSYQISKTSVEEIQKTEEQPSFAKKIMNFFLF